jgi:two-component system OmpR family sensor kinase
VRLRTRLLLYFLAALAAVLVGFSASLYGMASTYLHRQADERLEAALNTLVAAAEVNEAGVEWEPEERRLSFGRRTAESPFAWRVADEGGRRLDSSDPADGPGPLDRADPGATTTITRRPLTVVDPQGDTWRVLHRRLEAPAGAAPKPIAEAGRSGRMHRALVLSAAVSLERVRTALRNLVLALTGLSLGVWAVALAAGRWLCRRVLRPVAEMAEAAHALGDDPSGRLPEPATDDELGELGRSFNGLLGRLHESSERQRRFAGDASHQLRTPLTAIQGQVDLALRQERDAGEYRRVLALVQRRTQHLRQIVEALLFLARADAEAQAPGLMPVELSGWLAEHLGSRPEVPRSADVTQAEPAGGPAWVRAQPALLGELADILLDNAGKYGEPGTPIVVRLRRDGPWVRLSVEDSGIGIPPGELPHVFEPFYRSESARSREAAGVGLGLSVARRLAEAQGGRIEASSREGMGSTFTVSLPACPEAGSRLEEQAAESR